MAALHRLAVAALGQPFERVLTNRLQHPEARLAAGHALGPKQIIVQERLHAVEDVELEVTGDGPAPSSVKPPTKTARLVKSACSSRLRRS